MADGIGKHRTTKYAYLLKKLAHLLDKDFKEANKDDVIALVGKIEASDYKEWTKHDYKVALKKFYKGFTKKILQKVGVQLVNLITAKCVLKSAAIVVSDKSMNGLIRMETVYKCLQQ